MAEPLTLTEYHGPDRHDKHVMPTGKENEMGQCDERTSVEERLLLDVKEVSALLHLGERTIWKLNAMGEFPAPVRFGRAVRWDRRVVEAWLNAKNAEAQKKQERIRKSP